MQISDLLAALRWWTVLMIIGLLALPLVHYLLRDLSDRGYAFAKVIGVLIVSFSFWLFGSLGFLQNNIAGILFGIFVLVSLSTWITVRARRFGTEDNAFMWLRSNWKYVLTVELLFSIVFLFWTWVRSQNPAISATEKPMEFAFLNSLGRSVDFPPVDPWLSGFAISYYYFGYVMMSVIGRLAFVPEPIGFNLAIAWLIAATSLGAFGLVYNIIGASAEKVKRNATVLGLAAAIALPMAGNMQILFEVLHANGVGNDALWEWLDIRDLDPPAQNADVPRYTTGQWWWWRSSRVIHEYHLSGRAEEGLEPIAEFPSFSFILGDLHAHVLALPYAFLSLAVSLSWWKRKDRLRLNIRDWFRGRGPIKQLQNLTAHDRSLILFTALVLGGLSFLNTWDVIIHLFIVLATVLLAQWRRSGSWQGEILQSTLTLALFLVALVFVLYLPFYIGFRSQAGPPFLLPMVMRPTRLIHFLIIFWMPLIAIILLLANLVVDFSRQKSRSTNLRLFGSSALFTVILLVVLMFLMLLLGIVVAGSDEGISRVTNLASELEIDLPPIPVENSILPRLSWAVGATFSIAPELLSARVGTPFLIITLCLFLVAILYLILTIFSPSSEEQRPIFTEEASPLPFVLLLVGTGVLLSLGPEFVYLRDNFGQRINTIFKFYYQAWVLFGVSALFGIDYLFKKHKVSGWLTVIAYGAALLVSLMFPYYAIQSRAIEYRGPISSDSRRTATLDGLAYLADGNQSEYEAINWLRVNVAGTPVILEAVGGQYSGFGRMSAATGLPTILGWAGHEYQWRGTTPEPALREPVVRNIYENRDLSSVKDLLDQYEVSYIVYGSNERNAYNPGGEVKFSDSLEIAYQNDGVTIYQWHPQ